MDIFRRRQIKNNVAVVSIDPYKAGTKRLKKGFKHVAGGMIKEIQSGRVFKAG
jgi:hypothetical protein